MIMTTEDSFKVVIRSFKNVDELLLGIKDAFERNPELVVLIPKEINIPYAEQGKLAMAVEDSLWNNWDLVSSIYFDGEQHFFKVADEIGQVEKFVLE